MRKLLCGLLVVSAVVAFPAAASAAGCYDMLYGNESWGISEGHGTVSIHVNGRPIRVYSREYRPYPPRDIMLTFALRRIALAVAVVAVVESVITFLVLKRRKRKSEKGVSNLLPFQT